MIAKKDSRRSVKTGILVAFVLGIFFAQCSLYGASRSHREENQEGLHSEFADTDYGNSERLNGPNSDPDKVPPDLDGSPSIEYPFDVPAY